MDKLELLDIISELVLDNSNIGAEPGQEILIDNLEDVMLNVSATGGDVTLLFKDGTTNTILVK